MRLELLNIPLVMSNPTLYSINTGSNLVLICQQLHCCADESCTGMLLQNAQIPHNLQRINYKVRLQIKKVIKYEDGQQKSGAQLFSLMNPPNYLGHLETKSSREEEVNNSMRTVILEK